VNSHTENRSIVNRSDLTFYLLGKKYGFNLRQMVKFVNENQYWSEDQTYAYQLEHLKKIIRHAYDNVPFYRNTMRDLGIEPEDIRSLEDIKQFPVIDKSVILNNIENFKASNFVNFHPMARSTGGTTGVPFRYYNDRVSWGLNWATKIRAFQWGGYDFGSDRIAVLKGGSMYNNGKLGNKTRIWRWLQKNYSFNIMTMSEIELATYAKDILERKIKYMRGYPSAIASFAKWTQNYNVTIGLNKVFTTAEMLLPHDRALVEETFRTKIIDTYGCGDGMGGASQCDLSDKYHINVETSIMEILDSDLKNDVKPGEIGEIVLTSLHDYAMPFIRYAPGDQAMPGTTPCGCGISLPVLDRIVGRVSDAFFLPNGRVFNGLSVPLEDWTDIVKKFQIIHEKKNLIVVKLVVTAKFTKKDEDAILALVRYNAGEGIDVEIQIVDDIPLTKAGKYKYVVSMVENGHR